MSQEETRAERKSIQLAFKEFAQNKGLGDKILTGIGRHPGDSDDKTDYLTVKPTFGTVFSRDDVDTLLSQSDDRLPTLVIPDPIRPAVAYTATPKPQ